MLGYAPLRLGECIAKKTGFHDDIYALLRLKRQSQKRRELTVVLEVGRVDTGTGGLEDTVINR